MIGFGVNLFLIVTILFIKCLHAIFAIFLSDVTTVLSCSNFYIDILSGPKEFVPLAFLIISIVCSIVMSSNFHVFWFLGNILLNISKAEKFDGVNWPLSFMILSIKN